MKASRIISILLVSALLLLFAVGCSDDKPGGADKGSTGASDTDVSGGDVSGSDVSDTEENWYESLSVEEKAVVNIALLNVQSLNLRDIEGYMSTIDPASEVYESTREDAEYVLSHYRLEVNVEIAVVEKLTSDSATLTVTQTTLPLPEIEPETSSSDAVSSGDIVLEKDLTSKFAPCTTVLEHKMIAKGGQWYISSTVVKSYREINHQWELFSQIVAADPSVFAASGPNASGSDVASGADLTDGTVSE